MGQCVSVCARVHTCLCMRAHVYIFILKLTNNYQMDRTIFMKLSMNNDLSSQRSISSTVQQYGDRYNRHTDRRTRIGP